MEGAAWLPGVGYRRYPLSQSVHQGNNSKGSHIVQSLLILVMVLEDTFHLACWTGEMEGSVQIMYISSMSPLVLNERGKACFRTRMTATIKVCCPIQVWCGAPGGQGLQDGLEGYCTTVLGQGPWPGSFQWCLECNLLC